MFALTTILAAFITIKFGILYGAYDALAVKYRKATHNVEPLKKNVRITIRTIFAFMIGLFQYVALVSYYGITGPEYLFTAAAISYLSLHIAFVLAYNSFENKEWYFVGTSSRWDRFLHKLPLEKPGAVAIRVGTVLYIVLIGLLFWLIQ